ncbi:glycosyltransferase family 4 protein [Acidobacteria bacterium AH-259-L09]|nr:glycosyltransferase family 4 protein [Acidobacteria bacterium AH-259-L09]
MHILLIHQVFTSIGEPGSTRHIELSQHLAKNGNRVTVLAGQVNYLTGTKTSESRLIIKEAITKGVEVWRCCTYSKLNRGFTHRLLAFFAFMVSSLLAGILVKRPHLVWGTSPSLFQTFTAYLIARLKRVPFVFEVRDLWPDFAVEAGVLKNRLLIWASRRLEHFLYHHADFLIVNSPGFTPHLFRCGVSADKVALVANGVEVENFNPDAGGTLLRRELGLQDKFLAVYLGAHGIANDLRTLLFAAQILQEYPNIVVVLVGDGKERSNLILQAHQLGLGNVVFAGAQPKSRVAEFLAASNVCIAILKAIPIFTTTYPNKVFDYMAAGRPTILAIDGVIREVIEASNGGTFVPPGNPHALAQAVLTYYRNPQLVRSQGLSARRYVTAHFNREKHARELESLFISLVGRRISDPNLVEGR